MGKNITELNSFQELMDACDDANWGLCNNGDSRIWDKYINGGVRFYIMIFKNEKCLLGVFPDGKIEGYDSRNNQI